MTAGEHDMVVGSGEMKLRNVAQLVIGQELARSGDVEDAQDGVTGSER